jgi:hypothetical protein
MARTPKGSVVRFDPDWWPRQMQYGAQGLNLSLADSFQDAILYNNATDGTYLVVWDMTVQIPSGAGTPPASSFASWGVAQQPPVNVPTPGFPLDPFAPQGFGIVSAQLNSPGINNVPYNCLVQPGLWQWPHPWPMCYIPPTYALVVNFSTGQTSGDLFCSATWMWQSGVVFP